MTLDAPPGQADDMFRRQLLDEILRAGPEIPPIGNMRLVDGS